MFCDGSERGKTGFWATDESLTCQVNHLPMNVVKELMGHADISTTAKFYSAVSKEHEAHAQWITEAITVGRGRADCAEDRMERLVHTHRPSHVTNAAVRDFTGVHARYCRALRLSDWLPPSQEAHLSAL